MTLKSQTRLQCVLGSSCYVLDNTRVPIASKSITSLGLLHYRQSINTSNWIKNTHHMAKIAKHFDSHHSGKILCTLEM